MHMDSAMDVLTPTQNTAVQRKAWPVDASLFVEIVIHAALHQIGCSHLRVEQLMPFDQEMARIGRAANGGMIENDIAPPMMRQEPIDCCEVDPGLPIRIDHCIA